MLHTQPRRTSFIIILGRMCCTSLFYLFLNVSIFIYILYTYFSWRRSVSDGWMRWIEERKMKIVKIFTLTSSTLSIGISRTVRWMLGTFVWPMGGESGLSTVVNRGLSGLIGECGDLGVMMGGDRGISMIGLGVFRGGTAYSDVPVDLNMPLRTFHGL